MHAAPAVDRPDASTLGEDERLIALLLSGEPAALDATFEVYWTRLSRYAARLTGDVELGADLAQEVLARLWWRRAELRMSGSLKAYLYRAVRNAAVDQARRSQIRARWSASAGDTQRRVSPPTPCDMAEAVELSEAADRAIQQLPPRRREVFTLAHLREFSYVEIGQVMGISPQTVANHMSLALADLHRALYRFIAPPTVS